MLNFKKNNYVALNDAGKTNLNVEKRGLFADVFNVSLFLKLLQKVNLNSVLMNSSTNVNMSYSHRTPNENARKTSEFPCFQPRYLLLKHFSLSRVQ